MSFTEGFGQRSDWSFIESAKLADLYAKGKIGKKQDFINESIIGSVFKGKIIDVAKVGEYEAIIPEITGSAWITGFNHHVIDSNDPLGNGFAIDR